MIRKVPRFDGKLTIRLKQSFDPALQPRGKTPGLGLDRMHLDTIFDDIETGVDLFNNFKVGGLLDPEEV